MAMKRNICCREMRVRYPSPLVKQELAKLSKDSGTREEALASLRVVVENHIYSSSNLARFLQQVEDNKGTSRRQIPRILQDLARSHGPHLVPHFPKVFHLLVQGLLASADSTAVLESCCKAVCCLVSFCACSRSEQKSNDTCCNSGTSVEAVLCQICLYLAGLLDSRTPPLSSGAASCLRTLIENTRWQYAPPSLVSDLCWKASMATSSPITRSVPHLILMRSLAMTNPTAMSRFVSPLLCLALDILVEPNPTLTWHHRIAAVHLIESLLKAADPQTLCAHLDCTITTLCNFKRHDKLPQIRGAVQKALETAQSLCLPHHPEEMQEEEDNEPNQCESLQPPCPPEPACMSASVKFADEEMPPCQPDIRPKSPRSMKFLRSIRAASRSPPPPCSRPGSRMSNSRQMEDTDNCCASMSPRSCPSTHMANSGDCGSMTPRSRPSSPRSRSGSRMVNVHQMDNIDDDCGSMSRKSCPSSCMPNVCQMDDLIDDCGSMSGRSRSTSRMGNNYQMDTVDSESMSNINQMDNIDDDCGFMSARSRPTSRMSNTRQIDTVDCGSMSARSRPTSRMSNTRQMDTVDCGSMSARSRPCSRMANCRSRSPTRNSYHQMDSDKAMQIIQDVAQEHDNNGQCKINVKQDGKGTTITCTFV